MVILKYKNIYIFGEIITEYLLVSKAMMRKCEEIEKIFDHVNV